MGGQRALEWAVSFPERVPRVVVLAAGARATAEEIALSSLQIRAIQMDPRFRNGDYYDAAPGEGPWRGMSLARGIGQVSYRSEEEFDERFGRGRQADEQPLEGGRYQVESYLEYHGEKLADRFDANTYIVLSRAMNHHDVGRGRGGIQAALGSHHRRRHDRRHLVRLALPAAPPARARGAHPAELRGRGDPVDLGPRRLPHRDRGRQQGDHPRPRRHLARRPTLRLCRQGSRRTFTAQTGELVSRRLLAGLRARGRA